MSCHRIKICGLQTETDALCVSEAGADFAGMVFAPSRRQVSHETAAQIRKALDPRIPLVGVFVNAHSREILKLASEGTIQIIQLHGDETAQEAEAIKATGGVPIIKAFRVADREDVKRALNFPADYLLFDTFVAGNYGGTGQTFDWGILDEVDRPYFLAGGLTPENISGAMATGVYALDISSGVETDGRKDPVKIRRAVSQVHGGDILL
jgi:phosphoribosylanthranilate isomerase